MKDENNFFNQYSKLVEEAFLREGIMDKSYSHKPHLASLPYNHNTNDVDKLQERKDAIDEELKKVDKEMKDLKSSSSDVSLVNRAYYGNIWSLPELLKELTTGYDIETGTHTQQGTLPLSNGREVPIHFGGGSDLPYFQQAGYDVTEYAQNNWEFKENVENVKDRIINDCKNFKYDKDFHNYLKEWVGKSENNVSFLDKIKNDEVSPNGQTFFSKPSSALIEWNGMVNDRIDTFEFNYNSHKKNVDKYNKLSKIRTDFENEKTRTVEHIDRVTD